MYRQFSDCMIVGVLLTAIILVVPPNTDAQTQVRRQSQASPPGGASPADDRSREATSLDILSTEEWRRLDESAERGLAWLSREQRSDGSIPTQMRGNPGVTSLAVLAYLSRNHLPGKGPHGDTLSRAVDFIIKSQKPNGLFSVVGPAGEINPAAVASAEGVAASYNHAISSLALSELYAMSDQPPRQLQQAIERALEFSLARQQTSPLRPDDTGGWRYLHSRRNDGYPGSDLSVTGWYLMALRSARSSGFDVPEAPITEAVEYVKRTFDARQGAFLYYDAKSEQLPSRGMAGAGILALAHGGEHNLPEARRSGDWILRHPFNEFNGIPYGKDHYYYSVFYCSQAMYQLGGHYWELFFPTASRVLIDHQSADGGWPPGRHPSEQPYGRTYATAMAILAISAPNQLLPIFQR